MEPGCALSLAKAPAQIIGIWDSPYVYTDTYLCINYAHNVLHLLLVQSHDLSLKLNAPALPAALVSFTRSMSELGKKAQNEIPIFCEALQS